MKLKLQQQIGLWRSLLIYYAIPFRARRLFQFYSSFIQPGDLCFDIGAHVGNHLRAFSKLGAQVVALEPQPHFMRFLKKWYGQAPNITLLQEAAGATPGQTTMYVSRLTPTVTSLSKTWINQVRQDRSFATVTWNDALTVRLTTLDQLIERFGIPVFCKIDVEGYEIEVLKGLSQSIATLSFEFIPSTPGLSRSCITQLAQIGNYVFNWQVGENYKFQSSTWLNASEMVKNINASLKESRSGDIYARLKRHGA